MILDGNLLFSKDQAVTATAPSTNAIDLGLPRDIGVGENLFIVVLCTVAMTDTGSDSTVTASLDGEATTPGAFTPDSTIPIGTFPALSPAGTMRVLRIPPGSMNLRYAQVNYTVAGGNLTTGSFTAFIAKDIDLQTYYAKGFKVS